MKLTIDDVNNAWLGHMWDAPTGVVPAVRKVREYRRFVTSFTHTFPVWDLDYYFTPGLNVTVDGPRPTTLRREGQTAHLYPPGRTFHETTEPGVTAHNTYVFFHDGDKVGLDRFVQNRRGFGRFVDPRNILGKRMLNMARTAQIHGDAGFWRIQSMFFDIIEILHLAKPIGDDVFEITEEQRMPQVDPIAVGVIGYLNEHLHDPIGLADIARHLGISVSSLSHRYREVMDEGPMKSLLRIRIQLVQTLLLDGHGLKFIARQTGFGGESHLCKAFKNATGKTPSAYIASHNVKNTKK